MDDDPADSSAQRVDLRKESKHRTLLIKIHLQRYWISWEELDFLFARFGMIECIEILCPGDQFHSKIRFQQRESAIRALESFNHRDIYDGCCRLELFLEAEIDDGASKIETPIQPTLTDIEVEKQWTQAPNFATVGEFQDCKEIHEGLGMEIVEEFNKIEQEDDLDEYNEKFEDLRIGMLAYNPDLPEMYFVTSYIRGLRPEVRLLVKIGRPESLAAALKLSRLHNEGVQAMLRISNNPWRTHDSETQFVEDEALEFTQGGENPGVDRRLIDDGEYGKDLAHNEEIVDSFEVLNQEIKEVPDDLLNQSKSSVQDELKINSMPFNDNDREKLPNQQRTFKVNRKPPKSLIYGGEINWLAELVILLIELMEIRLANSRIESVGSVRNSSAHQVFEKMFEKGYLLVC